jgi:hypothetical protein
MRKLIFMSLAVLAVLAGCGGEDEPTPNVVDVAGDEYAFVMPGTIEGGWTTLRLRNTGREPHGFALVRLEGGKTLADVRRFLGSAEAQQGPPPDWVEIRAGIPTLERGGEASLTQRLEPGRYALICFLDGPSGKPHFADGMIGVVDVAGDAGAEPPKVDATLELGKGLTAPSIEAGERTLELRNGGDRPNAVFLLSYEPGKTSADLIRWEEGGMRGPAPGRFHGGAIGVPPRTSVYYTYTFEPGREYAVVDDVNEVERRFRVS